jgi:hypothetical protein
MRMNDAECDRAVYEDALGVCGVCVHESLDLLEGAGMPVRR